MATGKKSFIFYSNWVDTFNTLPDEKAGQLIKHILAYVNDENPHSDDLLINAVFANIKNILKSDLEKWEQQQQQRIEAGKKSAEIRKRNATTVERPLNEKQQASTVNDNVNVIVNVNDNETVINNKKGLHLFKNSPYYDIDLLKLEIDTDKIKYSDYDIDYYHEAAKNHSESKGAKYKDWKAALRNWINRDIKDNKAKKHETSRQNTEQPKRNDFKIIRGS